MEVLEVNKIKWYQKLGIPHHEFWPWYFLTLPIVPRWIWSMLKLRSLTYFTAVNPSIEDAGFIDESKIAINNLIPKKYLPNTINFNNNENFESQSVNLQNSTLNFPLIAKPDKGGRGRKIEIVKCLEDLKQYHQQVGEAYLVQELIEYPLELSIFYYYLPKTKEYDVISLIAKEFLTVIGDGTLTIRELLQNNFRGKKQIKRFENLGILDMNNVPAKNEKIILEPIGNHIRGTIFRNYNYKINDKLKHTMHNIAIAMGGIYFGRFDLKVPSWEHLYEDIDIKILEFNGVGADLAHIFDPNISYRQAIKDQWQLGGILEKVAAQSIQLGNKVTSTKTFIQKLKRVLQDLNA